MWRYYGICIGTVPAIERKHPQLLEFAEILLPARAISAGYTGSMKQRSHIMTFVKTLSAPMAAGDDEVVQAVRERARHVAVQAINSGLFAARNDLKADLQISKLSAEQEIELRNWGNTRY